MFFLHLITIGDLIRGPSEDGNYIHWKTLWGPMKDLNPEPSQRINEKNLDLMQTKILFYPCHAIFCLGQYNEIRIRIRIILIRIRSLKG